MKFYERHFDEYLASADRYNLHPDLNKGIYAHNSDTSLDGFENMILYGPGGSGKYTQALEIIRKYSPTALKYERHIFSNTEKQTYMYHISDIHYEIDMSLLGCNSKVLWSEIFVQISEIISVKSEKKGIIICKNFHMIHNELLDIFYSYIQQYNSKFSNISIKFILITEHIGFIPHQILNSCIILSIPRPSRDRLLEMCVSNIQYDTPEDYNDDTRSRISGIMETVDPEYIINIKEMYSFAAIKDISNIPADVFNTICDNIIGEIMRYDTMNIALFRDAIYDIPVYNLDANECVWYIICHFIKSGHLKSSKKIEILMSKMFAFLKYRNNNYREIFHLESIMFAIMIECFDIKKSDI
jgi:hypothetical protein